METHSECPHMSTLEVLDRSPGPEGGRITQNGIHVRVPREIILLTERKKQSLVSHMARDTLLTPPLWTSKL